MLRYTLDDVISEMMDHDETQISAEAKNAVNFCLSTHPNCKGTTLDRIRVVQCAIVGRNVHSQFRKLLEQLASKELRAGA